MQPKIEQKTLENGIRLVHVCDKNREVAHCAITINVGSRDENSNEMGMAHFIEHCFFKGTKKRKTFHILNRLDSVGGELNAFTTKEDTVVYGSFLNEYFERAVELISDITFNSIFPKLEIEKEKEVIIDEIRGYADSPSDTIFDDFDKLLYPSNSLGNNILGTVDSVNSFSKIEADNFIKRNYDKTKFVFSSIGDFPLEYVEKIARKYLNDLTFSTETPQRIKPTKIKPTIVEKKIDATQGHHIFGGEAYHSTHPKRNVLYLINNVLGGAAMNSKLNLNIREKYGYTYGIESNLVSYCDSGFFSVYFSCDKKHMEKMQRLALKELEKFKTKKMGIRQLHDAKKQLIGQLAIAQESNVNLMLALGKTLLVHNKLDSQLEIFNKIDKISASDILDVANEIFVPNNFCSLTFLPK